ncbi:MAG: hypothetical protein ACFFBS_04060 [Promethearchaeota archaeon]
MSEEHKGSRTSRIIIIAISIVMLAAGGYLIYLGITSGGDFLMIMLGLILMSFVMSFLNVGGRAAYPSRAEHQTLSIIKCRTCDFTEIRDFERGDYIFKEVGDCKECQGKTFIKTIYTVPLRKEKA